MIEDADVARALGWTQQEVHVPFRIMGADEDCKHEDGTPVTQPVRAWLDECGRRHPLRPFTVSYDVMMDVAKERGLCVAFRSDEDVVVVWRRWESKDTATAAKGFPLVEGFCVAMLDQLGLLNRLPAHLVSPVQARLSRAVQRPLGLQP